jgi:hypothetical protein
VAARAAARKILQRAAKTAARKIAESGVKKITRAGVKQGVKRLGRKAVRAGVSQLKSQVKKIPQRLVEEGIKQGIETIKTKVKQAQNKVTGARAVKALQASSAPVTKRRMRVDPRKTRTQSGGFASFGVMRVGAGRGVAQDPIRYDGYKWYEDVKRKAMRDYMKKKKKH